MADRWRESPAFDAITMVKLPRNQLFHSQCWKHIERDRGTDLRQGYEVRCIDAAGILPVVTRHGPPLSAVAMHVDDGEGIVAGVERWMCNQRVVQWNVAMTGQSLGAWSRSFIDGTQLRAQGGRCRGTQKKPAPSHCIHLAHRPAKTTD